MNIMLQPGGCSTERAQASSNIERKRVVATPGIAAIGHQTKPRAGLALPVC